HRAREHLPVDLGGLLVGYELLPAQRRAPLALPTAQGGAGAGQFFHHHGGENQVVVGPESDGFTVPNDLVEVVARVLHAPSVRVLAGGRRAHGNPAVQGPAPQVGASGGARTLSVVAPRAPAPRPFPQQVLAEPPARVVPDLLGREPPGGATGGGPGLGDQLQVLLQVEVADAEGP